MEGPAEGLTVAERKLESGLDPRPPITAGMCDVLFEGFFFNPCVGLRGQKCGSSLLLGNEVNHGKR